MLTVNVYNILILNIAFPTAKTYTYTNVDIY